MSSDIEPEESEPVGTEDTSASAEAETDAPTATAGDDADGAPVEDAGAEPTEQAGDAPTVEMTEEAVVALIAERDEYLDALQRLKAEFANARRRSDEQASGQRQQAAADLVGRLLPVLDSAQAALQQGVEEVRPLTDALLEVLTSQGLAEVDPVGEPFDPELHEAVLFESGEGEQVVIETMRLGYHWNDRVLRAAMVKVRG